MRVSRLRCLRLCALAPHALRPALSSWLTCTKLVATISQVVTLHPNLLHPPTADNQLSQTTRLDPHRQDA